MSRWSLYLIKTRDGSFYTGISADVARRFAEHQAGGEKCARYLRGRGPLGLVFQREVGDRSVALRAEVRIKRLSRAEKEEIVRLDPPAGELLVRIGLGPVPNES